VDVDLVCAAYLDVPMARHLYGFGDELAALKKRPAVCLGFGLAVALMLWCRCSTSSSCRWR